VRFDETLDLTPFMSSKPDRGRVMCDLTGVLVHWGATVGSGHYVAFVKAQDGTWHETNDDVVTAMSFADVRRQQAYILFYTRRAPSAVPVPVALPTPMVGGGFF